MQHTRPVRLYWQSERTWLSNAVLTMVCDIAGTLLFSAAEQAWQQCAAHKAGTSVYCTFELETQAMHTGLS